MRNVIIPFEPVPARLIDKSSVEARFFMSHFRIPSLLLLCSAFCAAAAEPSDTLGTVVVTAIREGSSVSVASPVQTMGIERLKKLGITDMADAVRRFAGATVKDYGGIGGLKTVSVRNMGASHTAVSYDGVAMTNTQGGQIDIGRLSLDNVSSVSLAIGSEPDLLQSARLHASAAVLAVQTARPRFNSGRKTALEASVKAGSWATVSPWVRVGRKFGGVTASVDADFLRSDANYPFTIKNGTQTVCERRRNSSVTSVHSEANIYIPAGSGEIQLKGYYFWSERGLPGAVTLYNPVSTERLTDRNFFTQARYRVTDSGKWRVEATAKYSYGYNLDREEGPQFADGIYRSTHSQREYYLSLAATYSPVLPLTFALAQDGAVGTLSSTMASCPYPTRFTSVSALSARWRKGILTANATLTATHITERVKYGDRPSDITRANPSAGISVRPFSEEQFYVRAMYKRTFRAPTFTDLYYDRVGNRTLRPEDADEFNAGLTWSGTLFPAMDYLSLTVDGYINKVRNKIVAYPSTYAWHMVNFGTVDIKGIDITMSAAFSLPFDMNLSVSGAYSLQRTVDITDPGSKNYRDQLPYTPRHSGNGAITLTTQWVTVGYTLFGVGKRYYMPQNIRANEIPGYIEQSITLSRELRLRSCLLTLRAELVNLGNVEYEVIKFYPMPGRSWRLTASFKL